jgi:hypothetical protein
MRSVHVAIMAWRGLADAEVVFAHLKLNRQQLPGRV